MNAKSTLFTLVFLFGLICFAKASIYPVPLSERIVHASHIVLGKLGSQHAFRSEKDQQIYTLNIIEVTAYLKGSSSAERIGLISLGGSLADEGQISYPSVQLQYGKKYALFLERDPLAHQHPDFPDMLQLRAYASIQGALPLEAGLYQDLLYDPFTERQLMQQVYTIAGELARQPDGKRFSARGYTPASNASRMVSISSVSSLSATGMAAGTIDTPRVAVIQGMGFDPFMLNSSTGSTIEFSSALDGGLSFIGLDFDQTDILMWTDTEIRVKIPGNAGSGLVRLSIFGAVTPVTHPITIDWAVIPKYSVSQGWSLSNRQRIELLREGGANNNGYAFQFDNTYWANLDAVESFLRAVQSWRCNTFVNLNFDTSPNNAPYINGNGSQVRFASAASLGAGVLAQAHFNFRNTFSALIPTCIRENTLWYVTDMDILFVDNPAPFSWNFGPNPSGAGSYDFESMALKMVGLATGLGYINQSGTAMYYSLPVGQDIRTLTANEIVAGTHKVTHSITPTTCKTQLAGNGLMTALNSGQDCILELSDLAPDNGELTAAAFGIFLKDGELLFEWKESEKRPLSLSLYDLQGRCVFKNSWVQEGPGQQKMDISHLASSLYAYRVDAGEMSWQGKVLK